MPRTRLYRDGVLDCEGFPLEDLSELTADPSATAWVDLAEADRAVLAAQLAQVAEELGLHRLAVEDAVGERQRPKLDRYESHLFVTAYDVSLDITTGDITTYEISVFVTHRVLVTVRKERPEVATPPGRRPTASDSAALMHAALMHAAVMPADVMPADVMDIDEVTARWDESPDLAKHGVGFLLWGLLDVLVDHQFEVVQALDEQIDALEDLLFAARPAQEEVQRRSFALRKSLVRLRHVVLPMREVVNSLMRRDLGVIDDAMVPYFQDVYDHVLRATEWTESLRDLVATVLETNLTIQGNRLNLIMKKVTSWAAIIAVPTAVTGFYGMNVPYPGFGRPVGFLVAVAVIAAMSVGLYALFRWRDWL